MRKYSIIPTKMYNDDKVDFVSIAFYWFLGANTNEDWYVKMTNEEMAKEYGCVVRTVTNHLKNLREAWYLDVNFDQNERKIYPKETWWTQSLYYDKEKNIDDNKKEILNYMKEFYKNTDYYSKKELILNKDIATMVYYFLKIWYTVDNYSDFYDTVEMLKEECKITFGKWNYKIAIEMLREASVRASSNDKWIQYPKSWIWTRFKNRR